MFPPCRRSPAPPLQDPTVRCLGPIRVPPLRHAGSDPSPGGVIRRLGPGRAVYRRRSMVRRVGGAVRCWAGVLILTRLVSDRANGGAGGGGLAFGPGGGAILGETQVELGLLLAAASRGEIGEGVTNPVP